MQNLGEAPFQGGSTGSNPVGGISNVRVLVELAGLGLKPDTTGPDNPKEWLTPTW